MDMSSWVECPFGGGESRPRDGQIWVDVVFDKGESQLPDAFYVMKKYCC